jgi:DNA repair photolyase
VRAYPGYLGDGVLIVFRNTAAQLEAELARRRRRPRAVFVSPSTDPFPPVKEVQEETAQVIEALARHGVEGWLMTRGAIDPEMMEVLAAHREHVKVTVAATSLDEKLQRLLEPGAAAPRLRLRQIAALRERGVRVQAALEPLVPGLTDTRDNLRPLLQALARAGVRHVTASYLFLRSGIEENLGRALEDSGYDSGLLEAYAGGPVLESPGLAPARYLPRSRRQRGYAALMSLAAEFAITVSVCGMTNPDFAPARPAPETVTRPTLLSRFLQAAI